MTVNDRLLGGGIVNLLDENEEALDPIDRAFALAGQSVVLEIKYHAHGSNSEDPILIVDNITMTQTDPLSF